MLREISCHSPVLSKVKIRNQNTKIKCLLDLPVGKILLFLDDLSDEVVASQPGTSTESEVRNSDQKCTSSKILQQISPISHKLAEIR